MTDLLPCPFCGSTNLTLSELGVDCLDCLSTGPAKGDATEAARAEAWNRRIETAADSLARTADWMRKDAITDEQMADAKEAE